MNTQITLKEAQEKHKEGLALKHRLSRLVKHYDSFKGQITERRAAEFERLRKRAEREFEEEKRKRIKAYHEEKARQRAAEEAEERRLREEEEVRQREEEEKVKAEEEKKRITAERRAKPRPDRLERDEAAKKQMQREEEAAARRAQRKAEQAAPAVQARDLSLVPDLENHQQWTPAPILKRDHAPHHVFHSRLAVVPGEIDKPQRTLLPLPVVEGLQHLLNHLLHLKPHPLSKNHPSAEVGMFLLTCAEKAVPLEPVARRPHLAIVMSLHGACLFPG